MAKHDLGVFQSGQCQAIEEVGLLKPDSISVGLVQAPHQLYATLAFIACFCLRLLDDFSFVPLLAPGQPAMKTIASRLLRG